ncbi:DUF2269 family protein [Cytobacillus purgationiresistens]|uniref:Membrane protein n=1 Tax=Cytobacillus purgationiresistens TaxID=863449 RepID=A0ABU0ART5_9BACI|nr:DUF2269 family protein [Cytobacillus purgationiresistens]MDQ0273750.1 putative membrane protein [Cytobacillus purgationiresistens]
MHQLYIFLVGIHIFAAIIGLGPALVFNRILRTAENMNELKSAHKIIGKLNPLSSIGFGLLVITGLLMGAMNPSLFTTVWYMSALGLFIILGIYSSFTVERKMKSMLNIAEAHGGINIPQEYIELLNKKAPYDWVQNALLLTIFILMVFKPW